MKTISFITLLSVLLFQNCFSQNAKTAKNQVSVKIHTSFKSAKTFALYKFNARNSCNQSKAVSIIKENQISSCFDFVKTINPVDTNEILTLLKEKSTYGGEDVACFDTDYSLVALDGTIIIGYINLSLSCNKLISNPVLKNDSLKSKDGLNKIGFSSQGKNKIVKILGL